MTGMIDRTLRGRCQALAEARCQADPSLRLVRGYYHDAAWGRQPHWWCVRPDGTIEDPSAAQFPTQGHGDYEPQGETVTCEQCGREVAERAAYWSGTHPACSGVCFGRLVGVSVP
jgi:hypothetical protein